MSLMFHNDPAIAAKALKLAMRERENSLSAREWKHRLAGYGYSVRDTDDGAVLETLPHRVALCVLPVDLNG